MSAALVVWFVTNAVALAAVVTIVAVTQSPRRDGTPRDWWGPGGWVVAAICCGGYQTAAYLAMTTT